MKLKISFIIPIVIFTLFTISQLVHAVTESYEYDDMYRLISVDYGNGITVEYRYDSEGNRTRKIITDGSGNNPPSVILTSPNGGENWSDTQNILWTATDTEQTDPDALSATLYYSTSSTGPWNLIASNIVCTSGIQASYQWDTTSVSDSYYWIWAVVSDGAGANGDDKSDASFTIINGIGNTFPSVIVESPNGGENWSDTRNILWTATDAEQIGTNQLSATLYLATLENGPWAEIITDQLCTSGIQASYSWNTTSIPDGTYWIRIVISDGIGGNGEDVSNASFTIDNGIVNTSPVVILIAPNGGEAWAGVHNIHWAATDTEQIDADELSAALYYAESDTGPWTEITTGQLCTSGIQASYPWDSTSLPDGTYWIRIIVYDGFGGNGEDLSDNSFTIARIIGAEYFIDNDPGEGAGTSILTPDDGTYDNDTESVTINFDTSGLDIGHHTVYVRFKHSDGHWGLARPISNDVYLTSPPNFKVTGDLHIVTAEYFIDEDPGEGNGFLLDAADGVFDNPTEILSLDFDTSSLDQGVHTLYVRIQDSNGQWGVIRQTTFEVSHPNVITAAKYFFDEDPGEGLGSALDPQDGAFDEPTEDVDMPGIDVSSLPDGLHSVFVRMKDAYNRWGEAKAYPIAIGQPIVYTLKIPVQSNNGDGKVPLSVIVADQSDNICQIKVEYSTNGNIWQNATLDESSLTSTYGTPTINNGNSYQIGNTNTNSGPNQLDFVWLSASDIPEEEHSSVVIRFTVDNGVHPTTTTNSNNFPVDNIIPLTPVLVPYSPDPTCNATPTLDWYGVEDAARYHIQISHDPNFTPTDIDLNNITASHFTPVANLNSGTIYWRVSAIDEKGNESAFSSADLFTLNADTIAPTVILTYGSNPATIGPFLITATFSEPIVTVPMISIDQPGTVDIMDASMSGEGDVWTYMYQVHEADGNEYLDGTATVTITGGFDCGGNENLPATNNTFTIDTTGTSETIVGAEYFIDEDPGEGAGTFIPAPVDGIYDSDEENVTFDLDTTDLDIGYHTVYVRFKNSNGTWGLARPLANDVYLTSPPNFEVTGDLHIVAAEYFIDEDPGEGNGNSVPAKDGAFDETEEDVELTDIDTSSLEEGIHILYLRMKDSNGNWGPIRQYNFEVFHDHITYAEYYFDNDPGLYNGTELTSADGSFGDETEYFNMGNIPIANLDVGPHIVCVRVFDVYGRFANECVDLIICEGQTFYRDEDEDGYGNPNVTQTACTQPDGYVLDNTDCDDANAEINPTTIWYKDADGDGYSDGTTVGPQCARPSDHYLASELTAIFGDCDDSNPEINPTTIWYKDADGDGYSDGTTIGPQCARPSDHYLASELIATSGDCNDTDENIHPGVREICKNEIDDNCNDQVDELCNISVPNDFSGIQEAIDAASEKSEIIVGPGTYEEVLNFDDKAITIRSEKGPSLTIIDANQNGGVVTFSFAGIHDGEADNIILDGFSITGGSSVDGGGIYLFNLSPTIKNCSLYSNTATNSGGAVYANKSSLTIIACSFYDNTAGADGGGIYYFDSPLPQIINSNIVINTASNSGGGIFNHNSSLDIINCTLSDNAAINGGGIYSGDSASLEIINSILWENSADGNPNELYLDLSSSATFSYSNIDPSLVTGPGTPAFGPGNINGDPLFTGNYHLQPGSPCIDTGDPASSPPNFPADDIDGDSRPHDGDRDGTPYYDMGSDEYLVVDPVPDIKANGSDGQLTIEPGEKLSVTIALNAGDLSGDNADWWVVVDTPMGWYYYNLSSSWLPGQIVTFQGKLFNLPNYKVLDMSSLPTGSYIFYFGVDMNMNGSIDMGQIYYDSVDVTITP